MTEIALYSEIRHLPKQVISELGNILQVNLSWKDIMGSIPGKPWVPGDLLPEENYPKKYSAEDVRMVSEECARDGRTGMEILIEEWGTSGKIRPKVLDLIHLLQKHDLGRAAFYLRTVYSNTDICDEPLSEVSAKHLTVHESTSVSCMSQNTVVFRPRTDSTMNSEMFESLKDISIPFIPFDELSEAIQQGQKIGQGAFGAVYKAFVNIEGMDKSVAIKVLLEPEEISQQLIKKDKVFKNEIEILSKCIHKNIIKLEAYSHKSINDLGLVYTYMENGSLYDQLACTGDSLPLPWKLRLRIAEGAAEGIVYLHTQFNPPLVHRDIKSPNILLDENFIPKLGDFGIVRLGGHGQNASTMVQTTPFGTQMFMAPEAFRGDVSVKMDTFSYGIVMLELLTGLPYFDENRENRDILSFVEEYEEDEVELLDASAGDWNVSLGKKLFEFAEICNREKKARPNMVQALSSLQAIINDFKND